MSLSFFQHTLVARLLYCTLLATLLTGCATTPGGTLTAAQISALQEAGFARTEDGWSLSMDGRILFDTDADALATDARESIARLARSLQAVGIDHLVVEGHTDNVGQADYNQSLSLRRAETVAEALFQHGFSPDNITRLGHGSTRPIADNRTPEGRAQNRRVAIIVLAH